MKARTFYNVVLCLVAALALASCVGPMGDQGAQGPEGPEGPQGPAGNNGQNGAENCLDCHGQNQLITAKIFQWENSTHYLGGHYERNTATCAGCHTSQGFLDRVETGKFVASMTIDDPLPQNCYTCHEIHQTYTTDDWALTSGDPTKIFLTDEVFDIGPANQCLACHQARLPSPGIPAPGAGEVINITNKRYGPHHGAQGMAYTGAGGFEIGEGYENSAHTTVIADACITCHMATVTGGREAGGHTFRVTSEEGELNTNGCVMCHTDTDELETLVADTQTEIQGLLTELGTKLNEMGILDDDLNYAIVPQDMDSDVVGILWNYKYVLEDQSLGVHNYKYVKTLLVNSIAALN